MRPRLIAKGSGRSIGAPAVSHAQLWDKAMAARMRVCERLRRVRFYGAERTRYARANTLLTDFAYHWPPRGQPTTRAVEGPLLPKLEADLKALTKAYNTKRKTGAR